MPTMLAFRCLRLLSLIPLILVSCGTASQPEIRLSELAPLPEHVSSDVIPLRVAVAAVTSPQGTLESYHLLLDYISAKLDRPVELVQRRTYAEINDLVERGYVDMAFVCTSAYIAGKEKFGMQLLAAPQVQGNTVYYSVMIVPAGSTAKSILDLRGKVFAFTDPMSTTGHEYPSQLVRDQGFTPDQFFLRTFFTYSHDDAIRAISAGLADGAAVDSIVLDYALVRDPTLATKLRVIHRSIPFGIPPVVINPSIRPQLKAQLEEVLLGMSADPDGGQAALKMLGVERFVVINDSAYDTVRNLLSETQGADR